MRHSRTTSPAGAVLATAVAVFALAAVAACGSSSSTAKSSNTTAAGGAVTTIKATKGGDFCKQVAATYNEAASFAKNSAATPDALRQELEKALKDGQDTIDNAPSEVKGDLTVIQNAVKEFAAALAKVGYDVSQLGADAMASVSGFSTPEFQQAATHSQAYVQEHCGIDLNTPTSTG